jgi:hypothetical protein
MADTGIDRVPASPADLRWWSEREWSAGVHLDRLAGLEQFAVRTRNTTYEITVMSPATGDVMIRGGKYFPEHTRAQLAGCSLGGSFLKVRTVHPGFAMELLHEGQRIVTTRVREITLRPVPPTQ